MISAIYFAGFCGIMYFLFLLIKEKLEFLNQPSALSSIDLDKCEPPNIVERLNSSVPKIDWKKKYGENQHIDELHYVNSFLNCGHLKPRKDEFPEDQAGMVFAIEPITKTDEETVGLYVKDYSARKRKSFQYFESYSDANEYFEKLMYKYIQQEIMKSSVGYEAPSMWEDCNFVKEDIVEDFLPTEEETGVKLLKDRIEIETSFDINTKTVRNKPIKPNTICKMNSCDGDVFHIVDDIPYLITCLHQEETADHKFKYLYLASNLYYPDDTFAFRSDGFEKIFSHTIPKDGVEKILFEDTCFDNIELIGKNYHVVCNYGLEVRENDFKKFISVDDRVYTGKIRYYYLSYIHPYTTKEALDFKNDIVFENFDELVSFLAKMRGCEKVELLTPEEWEYMYEHYPVHFNQLVL